METIKTETQTELDLNKTKAEIVKVTNMPLSELDEAVIKQAFISGRLSMAKEIKEANIYKD